MLKNITISIPIRALHKGNIEPLADLLSNEKEAQTQLFFELIDEETNNVVKLFARNSTINITKELINFLNENNDFSFKINAQITN